MSDYCSVSLVKIIHEEGRPDGFWHAVVPLISENSGSRDFEVTLNGGGISKARAKIQCTLATFDYNVPGIDTANFIIEDRKYSEK